MSISYKDWSTASMLMLLTFSLLLQSSSSFYCPQFRRQTRQPHRFRLDDTRSNFIIHRRHPTCLWQSDQPSSKSENNKAPLRRNLLKGIFSKKRKRADNDDDSDKNENKAAGNASKTDRISHILIIPETELDSKPVENNAEVNEGTSLAEENLTLSPTEETSRKAEQKGDEHALNTEDGKITATSENSFDDNTNAEPGEIATEINDVKEPQASPDASDMVEEEKQTISNPTEDEKGEEQKTNLPDPLDPRAHLAYFNEDREDVSGDETRNEETKGASRKFPRFVLFRRKMKKMGSTLEQNASEGSTKSSKRVVASSEDGSSSSPRKQKKTRLGRAVRVLAIVATLLFVYPLVADEPEERISIQPSANMLAQEELESVDPIVLADTEIDTEIDMDEAAVEQDSLTDPFTTQEGKPKKARGQKSRVAPRKSNSMALDQKRKVALSFVTDVVHEVGPAVVRVDTETHMRDQSDSPQPPGYVQQGQGSGLIFSDKGFILTNAHVVEDANKVTVTLTDGRVYTCQVMGSDEIVDIAVLKIVNGGQTIKDLPVAELGDSDMLSVGKIVIAVGSPGGLDNTVTMGIVSGLERSSTMVGIPHKKVDYIQTDAAINPGNSGGPLIDVESGKVVGINAAIRAHMEGTSFAIPINRVQAIMSDLADGREIQHGYLGLGLASCTPEWARQNNADGGGESPSIPEVYGAIIHKVFPRTPADKGGLRENDIILEIGSVKVKSAEDARRLIDLAKVGTDMPIVVLRGQKQITLSVRPVDLAARLREMRRERQQQMQQDRQRFQELGPFRSMLQ